MTENEFSLRNIFCEFFKLLTFFLFYRNNSKKMEDDKMH